MSQHPRGACGQIPGETVELQDTRGMGPNSPTVLLSMHDLIGCCRALAGAATGRFGREAGRGEGHRHRTSAQTIMDELQWQAYGGS